MKKSRLYFGFIFVLTLVFSITMFSSSTYALTTKHFASGFDYNKPDVWEISNGWSNGSMFNCIWRASNVTFGGGYMTLALNRDTQGSRYTYAGGEYRTRDTFGYGYYQVRMKPAKLSGIVSSFFTYRDKPWDEIDIEFLGKDTTKVQFNYFTNGVGKHEYIHNLGFDAAYGYHTYAFDWRKGYIRWLVDGKEVYRATRSIPSNAGKIMMNLWNGIGVDDWLGRYDGRARTASYDWMSYDP